MHCEQPRSQRRFPGLGAPKPGKRRWERGCSQCKKDSQPWTTLIHCRVKTSNKWEYDVKCEIKKKQTSKQLQKIFFKGHVPYQRFTVNKGISDRL